MGELESIDPYQTPNTVPREVDPETASPVLKDPRLLGWCAILAILIQIAVGFISMALIKTPDNVGILIGLQAATLLVSMVFFFLWFFRCAKNALRIRPHGRIHPVWGICCYFVPFVNLVLPLMEMRKLIGATFSSKSARAMQVTAIVWWVAFLVRLVISRAGVTTEVRNVWAVASVVAAGCVSVLIWRISRKQADFRWSQSPATHRVMMQPLGGRQTKLPAKRSLPQ